MDDFKLDCTTEIKTHDISLAAKLMEHQYTNTPSQFGHVVSCEIMDGIATTLWVFKLIKEEKS